MDNSITIRTVKSKKDLNDFIDFPYELYKNDPLWVPRVKVDILHTFADDNPFWSHSEKTLLLAEKNGKIAGRITGTIDRNYIEFQGASVGFFGFFECIEDFEIAKKLLDSVKNWLKEKKIKVMSGPFSPSTNDELSFLLEGYDSSPYVMMPYNPAYYHGFMEKFGLRKSKDLLAMIVDLKNIPEERYSRLENKIIARTPGVTIRPIDFKDFEGEAKRVEYVYNNAWEKNWGFVPWTHEEFFYICKSLKPLFIRDLTLIASVGDKPVGVSIVIPNYNIVFKKINGKLNVPGLIKFLYYKKKIKELRMMVFGVIKEYRNKGIEGLMYLRSLRSAIKMGYERAEGSWVLEDNKNIIQSGERLGAKVYKKYRVYEMEI